ncbi:MAG: acetoacetate--CoA ligase [Acidimicrobiales bacterium]
MDRPSPRGDLLYSPPPNVRDQCRIGHYMGWLGSHQNRTFDTYQELWQWSVSDLGGFWSSIWDYFEVISSSGYDRVLETDAMPGARWFPGARLNYAEHALGHTGPETMVVSISQSRDRVNLSADDLRQQVARARTGLLGLGVRAGDRVAAYTPNISETLAAFLATASLGAVWSSCAPEFGARAVLDRLTQIEPKVLFAVDGYRYGNKAVDRSDELAAIQRALPSLTATVVVDYLEPGGTVPGTLAWGDFMSRHEELAFERVTFDHPLYILYSSGTTGLPKPIIHGHGGILLEHLKSLALHSDLGPGDRFFWFSTTGWMMWNLLVSGLTVGAATVLFDGNPGWPDLSSLWQMAEETQVSYFGTSAAFIMNCRKAGLRPRDAYGLSRMNALGSTGSPLPPEGFDWVRSAVGEQVVAASVSGGTDVCTAFVGATPLLPVRVGEISGPYLGAKVDAFDANGRSVRGEQGELVITAPMPSMPVGFWGDEDGSRYKASYFDDFPGVWRHGDWITIYEDGACVISGRSDATLNRGGVRLGTSEFYSVVEALPEITDSLVIHMDGAGDEAGELLVFVVTAPGAQADDELVSRLRKTLASSLSPRHVPDQVHFVPAIPRTLSGKKLEVPVKKILAGVPVDSAASRGALADPTSLAPFEEIARQRATRGPGTP